MFEISVRFLGGEFVGSVPGGGSEWPPHPARLFYALTAAWFDGGRQESEAHALRWLEACDPPVLFAAYDAPEESYSSWVPMNGGPESKGRHYHFPKRTKLRTSRHVGDEPVSFVWDSDPSPDVQAAMTELARRVTCLGSSESLVAAWAGASRRRFGKAWRPGCGGTVLRVAEPGTLDGIVARSSCDPGRLLPCGWKSYRFGDARPPGRSITLGLQRGHWPVERTWELAECLRRTLLAVAGDLGEPIRDVLHGHAADGGALRRPHLQVCPLPFVGSLHATGAIVGLGLILPFDVGDDDRSYLERVVAAWFSRAGQVWVRHDRGLRFGPADGRWSIAERRWAKTARLWQSVLPVELPRNVVKRRGWDREAWSRAEAGLRLACKQAGLAEPLVHELSHTPFVKGSPHAARVARPRASARRPRRPLVHARIEFPEALEGPLVLGAGKHYGLGLMEPVEDRP